jgi:hypothetical protein
MIEAVHERLAGVVIERWIGPPLLRATTDRGLYFISILPILAANATMAMACLGGMSLPAWRSAAPDQRALYSFAERSSGSAGDVRRV